MWGLVLDEMFGLLYSRVELDVLVFLGEREVLGIKESCKVMYLGRCSGVTMKQLL